MKTKKFFLSNTTSNLFKVIKSLKGSAPKTNMVLRTYNTQLGDIQIKKQNSSKLFSSSFRFLSKRRTNFYSLYGPHKGLKAVKSEFNGFSLSNSTLERENSNKTNTINIPSSYWNQCFDKSRLKTFVLWFFLNHGEYKTVQLVEQLKNVGFEYATKAGISLGIEDLKIPPKKALLMHEAEQITRETVQQYIRGDITGVERFQRLIDTWHRTSEQLKQEVIDNFEATDILNPVYMMAFSGARGNISQVRQLVGMRGLMANPQGQIIDFPIRSNFREGLTLTEYIISSYGARKGIVDTALRTANAGYLTRRLVDVAQHVIISNFDCGTRRGIFLSDMKEGNKTIMSLQTRLVGRVCARDIIVNGEKIAKRNSEISLDLAYNISKVTKKVFVRSALTCETKKVVCQLCYGWSLAQGNLVAIGEAIGVIAAQSIGEPGTQLTMRTFHTGGVFSGDISDQIRMPFNGIVHFDSPIPGTLIRTPEGKITFLTKSSGSFTVLNVDSTINKNTTPKKFKIPEYTLLYVRHGEFASEKEVVAQISSISTQKNATDDAELTIKSELEGEFYLQRLRLKEIQVGPKLSQKEKQNINASIPDTVKMDSVSHLMQVSPMDSIFTAWNWGNAWILSGKVYQNPQPSIFFTKIGDYVNQKSSIVIRKTTNSFSNISGLVKLKKIAPASSISLNNSNKNSLFNNHVNRKSALPVYHFEFVAFQLSSIIYKKFGYFTKLSWSPKSSFSSPLGIKKLKYVTKKTLMPNQSIERLVSEGQMNKNQIKKVVSFKKGLKNGILTKNDSIFVIPPNGQVLLKQHLVKLYPSNWQSHFVFSAQLFPSLFQTNTSNTLVLEKISNLSSSKTTFVDSNSFLKGLEDTRPSDFSNFNLQIGNNVTVIQPVTVKKTKILPSFSDQAISVSRAHTLNKGTSLGANEKFWCLKEVNFSTKNKNSKTASKKVSYFKETDKIVNTSLKKNISTGGAKPALLPLKAGNNIFKINFSRIFSIPEYPDSTTQSVDFSGATLNTSVTKVGTRFLNPLFSSNVQNGPRENLNGFPVPPNLGGMFMSGENPLTFEKANGHQKNPQFNGDTKKGSLSNNFYKFQQKPNTVQSQNGHMTSSTFSKSGLCPDLSLPNERLGRENILNYKSGHSTNGEVSEKIIYDKGFDPYMSIPALGGVGDTNKKTSPKILSKIIWNLKNKQKTKKQLLNTTKNNLVLITKHYTSPSSQELKEGKVWAEPTRKKTSLKLIKNKKSFSLKTPLNFITHTGISKKGTSLSSKYIYEFSNKITTLFKAFLFVEYNKKLFTSFKKFYNNRVFSYFLKQLSPNPQLLLDSNGPGISHFNELTFKKNNSVKSNLTSSRKHWVYCLPTEIPKKKNKLAYIMQFLNKNQLVYPGQFINSELSFDQHIVSVKPFLIPTSKNLVAELPNFKCESLVLNHNCRFKKQSQSYSQIALKITKVDEFFINSLNVKEFLNFKKELSLHNQFNPDPTTNLVSFKMPSQSEIGKVKNLQKTYASTKMLNRSFSSVQEKINFKNCFVNKQRISPEILPKFPSVDFQIIPYFSFLKESKPLFVKVPSTDSKTSTNIRDSLLYLTSNKKSQSLFSFYLAFKQPDFLSHSSKSSNLSMPRRESIQAKENKESNQQLVYPFKEYKFDFSQGNNFGASWLVRTNTKAKNTKGKTLLTKQNLTLLNINSIFQSPILSSSLIQNLEIPVLKLKKGIPNKNNSSKNFLPCTAKFFVNPLAKGQYSSSLVTFAKTYSYSPFEGEVLHITSPFNNSNFNYSQNAFSPLNLNLNLNLKGMKQKTFNSLAQKESGRPIFKGNKSKLKFTKVNNFYQLIEKESSFLKIQQNTCMILTKTDLISFYLPLSNMKLRSYSPEGGNTLLNPLQSYVVKPTFVTLSLDLIKKLTNQMESEQLSEADASLNPLVYKLPQISSGFPKQGVQIKKRITSHYSSGLHRTKKKQKQLNSERTTKTNFAFLVGDFVVSGDSLLLNSKGVESPPLNLSNIELENSLKENLKGSLPSNPVEEGNPHIQSNFYNRRKKDLVKAAVTKSGQIIHLNKEKVTLRKGQPLFISPKSILHKYNGDFIEPKSPIITLSYQRLKTGDIVQGIPKIEQFFEARTTKRGRLFRDSLPNLVKALYKRYRQKLPLDKAVRQSFYKIQQIIVDGVLRVYRSQGVTIADKHLEIIVKQMTSKVRILEGGQTGFFPGEIVDLEFVEQVNELLMKKIQYEPLVLGITKSSLEVDSFLSAASFQQTTRVLSGAAISRKKDFLKGLKENVILGNLIPAGTGYLVYLNDFYSKKSEYKDAF